MSDTHGSHSSTPQLAPAPSSQSAQPHTDDVPVPALSPATDSSALPHNTNPFQSNLEDNAWFECHLSLRQLYESRVNELGAEVAALELELNTVKQTMTEPKQLLAAMGAQLE
ncbi:hypothetical protein BWQ96_07648 [Gracilariopsis chorda]|uniref:Uncharacterized protein n=1 Tax=Gracilariopsis chorda TaxID=448386 RepID=A0A2V3IKL9_9FLOR|nr:hypothetical protein BWQ96_07648 [Gracilariopsis chorda]|eukprot:PXF42644.1 hypothetical protein BWQ96_07648 [Gracilariopsis chorda]